MQNPELQQISIFIEVKGNRFLKCSQSWNNVVVVIPLQRVSEQPHPFLLPFDWQVLLVLNLNRWWFWKFQFNYTCFVVFPFFNRLIYWLCSASWASQVPILQWKASYRGRWVFWKTSGWLTFRTGQKFLRFEFLWDFMKEPDLLLRQKDSYDQKTENHQIWKKRPGLLSW